MKIHLFSSLVVALFLLAAPNAPALDASDFSDLIGFTVIAVRGVDSVSEGEGGDKLIKLQDGTTFRVSMLLLDPLPASHVAIFGRSISQQAILYKIAIKDRIYSATLVTK
jgi:hypothetical protein